jgi:hypothetical protein
MKKLENLTNVEAPSVDFPYGDLKNNTGTNNGTPVNRALISDVIQFGQKLADEAGVVINDIEDNNDDGWQLYEAFQRLTAKKYVKQVSSEFDGESFTITRAEIQAAFVGVNPFSSFVLGTGTSDSPFSDFSISVWALSGGIWILIPNTSSAGGANVSVNNTNGNVIIILNIAAVDPAVPVRFVLQG